MKAFNHWVCSEMYNVKNTTIHTSWKGNIHLLLPKTCPICTYKCKYKVCISHLKFIFKAIKILIHFVLSSAWICIRKAKLQGRQLVAKDVIGIPNLDNILKSLRLLRAWTHSHISRPHATFKKRTSLPCYVNLDHLVYLLHLQVQRASGTHYL